MPEMSGLELLKKISDTLGVLGLGELRQRVQDEIAELSQIVTDGKKFYTISPDGTKAPFSAKG